MDLSKLSTEDLQALRSGDLSKVSTAGLQVLHGKPPTAAPQTQPEMGLGRQLLGNAELAGGAVANIPYGIAHAAHDLYNRVVGNPTDQKGWEENIHVPAGKAGEELSQGLGNSVTSSLEVVPGVDKALTAAAGATHSYLTDAPTSGTQAAVQATAPAVGDIATLAGAKAPVVGAITKGAKGVANGVTGAMDAAGLGTDWRATGLRTGGAHPIARQVAGESGPEALVSHNAQVGNTVAASEAGHPQNAPLSPESLAEARQGPNSVYNRLATSLTEGPLSDEARNGINAIDSSIPTGTKSSIENIANLKQTLLGKQSWNGQELINTLRDLRQKGFANAASDVPDAQEFGKAQLGAARALEGHIEGAIPDNSPVSIDQFKAARQQLAKNWAVQGALRGGDVDLSALGRVEEKNPGSFTGGLKTLADFANGPGRDVVGIPNRYNPPSFARDLAGVFNVHRPVQATVQGLGGGPIARRLLTGSTGDAIDRALQMFPGRAPSSFEPLPSAQLPGGRLVRPGETGGVELAGQGANPNPPAAQPLGDLARVLSEGLEQRPPESLSVGPMGAPQGEGLPFSASPEAVGARPVHGGAPPLQPRFTDDYGNEVNPNQEPKTPVQLGDRFARGDQPADRPASVLAERPTVPNPKDEPSLADLVADLHDYAKVKSEGVPEGTAVKAGPRTGPSKPWLEDENRPNPREGNIDALLGDLFGNDDRFSNNASGQTDVSQEFANWQKERSEAGVTRHRYDPSTEEMVPMHSTSARDPNSVQGRPVFDRDANGKYTVIDRGGLSANALNGIINRVTQLGDRF